MEKSLHMDKLTLGVGEITNERTFRRSCNGKKYKLRKVWYYGA